MVEPRLAYGMLGAAAGDQRDRAALVPGKGGISRGRPTLEEIMASPRVRSALSHPQIDATGNVREGAGGVPGSTVTEVDKSVPSSAKIGSKTVDPRAFVAVHEQAEEEAMHRLMATGMPAKKAYDIAHTQYALPAERKAVQAAGVPWDKYESKWRGYLSTTEHETGAQSPALDRVQAVVAGGGKGQPRKGNGANGRANGQNGQDEGSIRPPGPDLAYGMLGAAADNPSDRAALSGQGIPSWLLRQVAPSTASLASGEPRPPMANLPEYGKVPSTGDPRFEQALGELASRGIDFVGPPGAGLAKGMLAAAVAPAARRLAKGTAEEAVRLGAYPTTTPGRILGKTKAGGYSVNVPTGEIPSEGLMMGIYGNQDPRNLVVAGRAPQRADVLAHGETNLEALQKPERYYGTWQDPESGNVYFDVSQRFAPGDIRQATKFGERTGQLAGYNVGAGQSFPVGNWEEFIKSPEFHARMHEMAGHGREYLSQFPAKEWWDMHGSPFERIYGQQNLPQVAGFTASTAPNTAPRENLQTMSEYMRRYISGEDVVQPDWRVPAGGMTRSEGAKIGMEASRAPNLQKAAAGDIAALQRDKVRSEAQAMMGDPNAVVLDRHWARLGEAPERGIYTSTQEGVISATPRVGRPSDYGIMESEVRQAARSMGRDPRDFSADAWTGIRDTIQRTGELYGQRFRGASIRGESKSYGDHLDDLVNEKAQHMGMTAQELEKRLRGGDATLLGTMLGAPTIGAAYRYWSAGQSAPASSEGNRATPPSL